MTRWLTEKGLEEHEARMRRLKEARLVPPVVGETRMESKSSGLNGDVPSVRPPRTSGSSNSATNDAVTGRRDGHRIALTLPWPPTGNSNVRHARGGHYLTAEHKQFRCDVAVIVVAAGLHRKPLEGRLKIVCHCWPPDLRDRNMDNVFKPLADALQHARMLVNDRQFKDIRLLEMPVDEKKRGFVNVFIEALT